MTIANIADYAVAIDGENFSVLDVPSKDTKLVQSERENTLKSIDLDKLCKDLGVTGDLINLAYNAIPSQFGNLWAAVSPLHKRFMTLLGKSETQMISIEETAKAILPNLKLVFRFLLEGKEDTAIKFLQTAADKATALHKGMSELAKDFEDLGNDTQKEAFA